MFWSFQEALALIRRQPLVEETNLQHFKGNILENTLQMTEWKDAPSLLQG